MTFLVLLIIGTAAGFLATRLMRLQVDVITTIALGVGGAWLSWMVLRFVMRLAGSVTLFIGAVLGAMALIWLWGWFKRR